MKLTLFPVFVLFALNSFSQNNSITKSANNFLSTLTDKQRSIAVYEFVNEERYNWHFFPKSDRKGISLNELDAAQKNSSLKFLQQCLSDQGYNKSVGIMELEGVLRELENRGKNDDYRDPGKYYFLFFGNPSKNPVWGWRLEGHHLSFNFSAVDNKIVAGTPAFMGSNPAVVLSGPQKGMQVLKEETEKGFELLHSLNNEQQAKAVINTRAPNEIITFVSRNAMIEKPEGINYSEMDTHQKKLFWELLETYIHRYTKLFADEMMNEIKAGGVNSLRFAWAGSLQPGKGHYYRLQGPTIIIEYDNTQGNANHVHTVVRDLKNDFGGDELLEHYKRSHK